MIGMSASIVTQLLIGQIQQGDRAALEELCRRYQQRVLAAVRVRLGAELRRKIESWDLVQEVMIEAVWPRLSYRTRDVDNGCREIRPSVRG